MRHTILILTLFISILANGQDLHYTYYQFTPLNVNPANAGAFSGSYRISGIYSDKFASVTARPYQTFTVSADAPIVRGIRKQDWIGIGIEFDLDKVGLFDGADLADPAPANGSFQNVSYLKVGAAYHLSLDKKQTNILTLGAQLSNGKRNFALLNQTDARVYNQTGLTDYDIIAFNQKKSGTNNTVSGAFKDISVGLLYNARRKKSDLRLGLAFEGVANPKIGLFKDTITDFEKKYFGMNIHGAYDMTINEKLHVIPGIYYYSIGPANALNINTQMTYQINPDKDLKLVGGLGVRNLRAVLIYAGLEFKDLKVGVAYDLDISSATVATKSVGGFEICASYLGKIYKKPKVKPVIFCPRL